MPPGSLYCLRDCHQILRLKFLKFFHATFHAIYQKMLWRSLFTPFKNTRKRDWYFQGVSKETFQNISKKLLTGDEIVDERILSFILTYFVLMFTYISMPLSILQQLLQNTINNCNKGQQWYKIGSVRI